MAMYISRNNQQLGPFEDAQVLAMLSRNELSPNDPAIRHGETSWQRLGVYFPQAQAQFQPPVNMMSAPVNDVSGKRTTRSFQFNGDIWPIVEAWVAENGYRMKSNNTDERIYQKGGFWVSPRILKIQSANGQTHLEAWVRNNIFTRLMSLFILPAEISIESGGFRAMIPRNMAREEVNRLLPRLGQPPIQ